ncbi:hypothetical protein Pfo_008251, partial [Paulownia fortunei]
RNEISTHTFTKFLSSTLKKKKKRKEMQSGKKMKMKKGWVAVQVGLTKNDQNQDYCSFQRFSIPISHLNNPLFRSFLDKAGEVYGYHTAAPLMLPCSVEDFLRLRWRIEKITSNK